MNEASYHQGYYTTTHTNIQLNSPWSVEVWNLI
jgi:hypothetical protein